MSRNEWLITIIVLLVVCVLGVVCLGAGGAAWWLSQKGPPGPSTPSAVTPPPVQPAAKEATLNLPGDDPPSLDPALTQDATSAEYIVEIFSGLVSLDEKLEVVPDIAERWKTNENRTVYTFYLRPDVKFHDGKPVTARDFKYSLERACDPRTESAVADTYLGDVVGCKDKLQGRATEVAGVKVLDDHTLEITIDAPKAYFLAKLTYPTAFVLDQRNVEQGGRTWTDRPNGTGPFKLKEYRLGQRIVLERNDLYYGTPKPGLKQVNYVLAGGSAMTMYENGELDAVPVGLNDIERVTDPANPLNKELSVSSSFDIFYLGLNIRMPPFDDLKVRQAFNHALDRDKLVNVVLKKTVLPARGILPPGFPGYNEQVKGLEYDPDKAKQLIAESSYGDVTNLPEITLHISGMGGAAPRTVEAIVEMLKVNLGVEVTIQQTDWATFLSDISQPRNPYQMFSLGWIADYPDPQNFLDILFHSGSLDNHTGYANPEVDRLLEQARVEQDEAKRLKLYQQIEQMIVDDAPWVPLTHGRSYWLTKPYVQGMVYPQTIIPKLKYVSISK